MRGGKKKRGSVGGQGRPSMGKAPVSRGGKKKGGSVRKSQPRPCWTCKTVEGGQVCHEHGGKWLRTAGKTAAGTYREVYSCGAAGCTSEVSKCQHCGLLHSGRDDRDYLAILNKCRRTIQPFPPLCPCARCRGNVGCRGVRVACGVLCENGGDDVDDSNPPRGPRARQLGSWISSSYMSEL